MAFNMYVDPTLAKCMLWLSNVNCEDHNVCAHHTHTCGCITCIQECIQYYANFWWSTKLWISCTVHFSLLTHTHTLKWLWLWASWWRSSRTVCQRSRCTVRWSLCWYTYKYPLSQHWVRQTLQLVTFRFGHLSTIAITFTTATVK